MLSKVLSGSIIGLDAVEVIIEVDISSSGLPSFTIVGLGDRAVEESKERVRSAIRNSGADFPQHKITLNLAPADLPKEGPIFDLPIALGLLMSSGQISADALGKIGNTLAIGELSLDGSLRRINGALTLALLTKKLNYKSILLPRENASEAALVEGVDVFAVDSLTQVIKMLLGQQDIKPSVRKKVSFSDDFDFEYDFSQIKGQEQAKRALEIAAAGAHNVLLKGPPGAGKTMLARSFPSILPPLDFDEAIEVTKIYSVSGLLDNGVSIVSKRPFRSPHHSASHIGLIGGGNNIRAGEITLAHRGVLFLDEAPEFPRYVLESLRQPLEDRKITISRASGSITFPSKFILIAAQNPCPCGFLGDKKHSCNCMPGQIAKYKRRISGPFLDRIDIHLEVPQVEVDKLSQDIKMEDSKDIRARVVRAREIQKKRFKDLPSGRLSKVLTNSEMGNNEIKQFCFITEDGMELLKMAISSLNLSARGYHRVLKLSRTIADLSQSENILTEHIAEALQYRLRDEL